MKFMTRLLCAAVLIGLLACIGATASAGNGVRVVVNGEELAFADAQPFLDGNGRTMVPIRAVGEAMGCEVYWNRESKTIYLFRDRVNAAMTIGKKEITVMGVKKPMDTSATLQNGRTLVPVRFIAEAFGAEVTWNAATRTVSITDTGCARYKIDGITLDIDKNDTLEINSSGFLTLTKESGLVLEEMRVKNSQDKLLLIKITVDLPDSDIDKQMEEAAAIMRQSLDDDFIDRVMAHAVKKQDGSTVIERKYFSEGKNKVYVLGYTGPIMLYVYL